MLLFGPLFRLLKTFGVDGAEERTFMELADESAKLDKDVFDKLTNPESESLKIKKFEIQKTLYMKPLEFLKLSTIV